MLPAHWFLMMLLLACPVYVVLHAISLIVPLYLLLLTIGLGMLYLLMGQPGSMRFEEVFSLLAVLIGIACAIAGFAMAPLLVQVLGTIALVVLSRRYQIDAIG